MYQVFKKVVVISVVIAILITLQIKGISLMAAVEWWRLYN